MVDISILESSDSKKPKDKTLSHASIGLVFGISILGFLSTILYFHRFNIEAAQPYDFSTLSLSATIILLTGIDILVSSRNYRKRAAWKGTTKTLAIITITLACFLTAIPWLYSWNYVVINELFELRLSEGNLSDLIDWICSKIGYLNLKYYLSLYPIAFLFQILSNLSRLALKRRQRIKRKHEENS